MSFWRMVWQSLLYHRRINFSVALGVAAASAVLTGALLVGASMRGSLKALTLDRLNRVDEFLVTQQFFQSELVTQLQETEFFEKNYAHAAGAIFFPSASLELNPGNNQDGDEVSRRASEVQILAADDSIWWFGGEQYQPKRLPAEGEVILNATLADALGLSSVDPGTQEVLVTLRLPKPNAVPSDSPLGEKEDLILNLPRLRVIEILPDQGLGRFGLHPTQLTPKNAFVSVNQVQKALDKEGKLNCLFAGTSDRNNCPPQVVTAQLQNALSPSFQDYGLLIKAVQQDQPNGQAVFDYFSISSTEMLMQDRLSTAILESLQSWEPEPVLTYLANDVAVIQPGIDPDGESGIPYSMIAAIDFSEAFDPVSAISGEPIRDLEDGEIVLNEWAAKDENAKPGDRIRLTYFEPETTHGQAEESYVDLTLKDIAKLTPPSRPFTRRRAAVFDQPPTLANDPDLTPEVPGVTDQESIENWDLPFSTADRIQSEDDQYWRNYRTTPKGFVSLAQGQSIWASRFGKITSIRVPSQEGLTAEKIQQEVVATLHSSDEGFGFHFSSLKRDGLKSASGTTPFDGLFIGLSLFIIVSALMLVVLLFKLGLEQRASEAGLLLATGFLKRKVAWFFGLENILVAALGSLLGVGVGVVYAAVMVYGLKTWWVGAIRTPFIDLYVDPITLTVGYFVSLFVCGLTIVGIIYRFQPAAVKTLLSGKIDSQVRWVRRTRGRRAIIGGFLVIISILGSALTTMAPLSGEEQAGAFMGSGVLLLTGLLMLVSDAFSRMGLSGGQKLTLGRLCLRNASRNSTRSTLTIGLVATASFLVGAISAFRMQPTQEGTAGYDLLLTTSRPIFLDFSDPSQVEERFGKSAEELSSLKTLAFRLKRGDDASCNNPYQVGQPRVLGVDERLIKWFDDPEHPAFKFSGVLSEGEGVTENPWQVLKDSTPVGEPIPVILDKNTAMWSLKVYSLGQEFVIDYDDVGPVRFKAAGFLANTVLQGSLFVGDKDFRRLFPKVSGYQYFLAQSGGQPSSDQQQRVRAILESNLGDEGMTTQRSDVVLEGLMAVQNTYLSTFQSLGALGLLLGTFGLATVQLRNILERKGELGLMRALGFAPHRLASMVLFENGLLLFGGLGIGGMAAVFVVLPHAWVGAASVPWTTLSWMFVAILTVGLLTGLIAVRATLQISLQQALREE